MILSFHVVAVLLLLKNVVFSSLLRASRVQEKSRILSHLLLAQVGMHPFPGRLAVPYEYKFGQK